MAPKAPAAPTARLKGARGRLRRLRAPPGFLNQRKTKPSPFL